MTLLGAGRSGLPRKVRSSAVSPVTSSASSMLSTSSAAAPATQVSSRPGCHRTCSAVQPVQGRATVTSEKVETARVQWSGRLAVSSSARLQASTSPPRPASHLQSSLNSVLRNTARPGRLPLQEDLGEAAGAETPQGGQLRPGQPGLEQGMVLSLHYSLQYRTSQISEYL